MKMQQLQGNTWYINFPSAVGIYIFPDNTCLLIDSGASEAFGRRIHKITENNGLHIRYLLNTHAHADHCGGNRYLQETTGCQILASKIASAYMENPLLIPVTLYSANPIKALKNKYLMPPVSKVNQQVEEGDININGSSFKLLALAGHSLCHIGIITPDQILFAGDSLISQEKLKEFPFLYLADVEQQLETLDKLKKLNINQVFLSHGGLQNSVNELIAKNYEVLMAIVEYVYNLISQPREREEILPMLVNHFNLKLNRNQYFLTLASLSAVLSYLCNIKQARVYTENNRLLFRKA